MMPPHVPRRLVIATRESALAMWQARHVQGRLEALYPRASVELLGLTTQGDQILDRPLAASDEDVHVHVLDTYRERGGARDLERGQQQQGESASNS